ASRSVLLATKGRLGEGATRYAQGGIAAVTPAGRAVPSDDSAARHLDDTLAAGAGLCDPAAVGMLVEEADAAVADLRRRGVRFDQAGAGLLARTLEGGHSRPRILHAGGDATGAEIERALVAGRHPLGDLAPRDVVTRAMAARMAASGADHLWLDATGVPAERLERRFPTILARCRAAGIEPTSDPIPVSPAAHYLMGGVR